MTTPTPVEDSAVRVRYVGDGIATAFPFAFRAFEPGDVVVYLDGVVQAAGFAVTLDPEGAGGSVDFAAPPAAGARLALVRVLVPRRVSDFAPAGPFRAAVINRELDRQVALLEQLDDETRRGLRLHPADGGGALLLPDAATRAGAFLAFDGAGAPMAAAGSAGAGELPVSAFAADNLLSAPDAAAARTALGLGSAAERAVGAAPGEVPGLDALGLPAVGGGRLLATRQRALPEIVHTGDATLDAAAAGTVQIADAGLPATFSLPAAAAAGAGFVCRALNAGSAALTLAPAGGETIDGAAALALAPAQWTTLWSTGTAWRTLAPQWTRRPMFRASLNGSQTGIPSDAETTVQFDKIEIDVGGYFDTTSYRWMPPRGQFMVGAQVTVSGGVVDQQPIHIKLFRNGSSQGFIASVTPSGGSAIRPNGTLLAFQEDPSDWWEVKAQIKGSGTKTISGTGTEFFGVML